MLREAPWSQRAIALSATETIARRAPTKRRKAPLSERLHAALMRDYRLPWRDFSHQAVARVMTALNAARAPMPPMVGDVVWISAPIGFTLPGPYVYLSRRFIERCRSDAPVAFVLAHEIGHHDLGHLDHAERWMTKAARMTPLRLMALLVSLVPRWMYSQTRELEADAYGLEICRRAGFDLRQCLEAFDILSAYSLDHRDIDGVYGSGEEFELDPKRAANPIDWLYIKSRLWLVRHGRSHPAIAARRRVLLAQIEATSAKPAATPSVGGDGSTATAAARS
jgi:Zn-dependent protease with chaperone function